MTLTPHTFTDAHGNQLRYVTTGNADQPPALLVHGYTSSHAVWQTTLDLLREDFYCVALDLLGHGASDVPADGDYSIAAQAERVLALADHLDIEQFTLVGHSMGGQIAMYLASILAPQRVQRLVNVSGVVSPRLTTLVEWTVFLQAEIVYRLPFLLRIFQQWRNNPSYARWQFATWFYDVDALDFDMWQPDRESALHDRAHIMVYKCKHAIKGQPMTDLLPRITAPTLTIFGADDEVIMPHDKYLAADGIPSHELVVFEACGHFPMYESPAKYESAVRDFLLDD